MLPSEHLLLSLSGIRWSSESCSFQFTTCIFYRCRVTGREADGWRVRFIDYGNTEHKQVDDLMTLPQSLRDIPPFAVELRLANNLVDDDGSGGGGGQTSSMFSLEQLELELMTSVDVEVMIDGAGRGSKFRSKKVPLLTTTSAETSSNGAGDKIEPSGEDVKVWSSMTSAVKGVLLYIVSCYILLGAVIIMYWFGYSS